MDGAVSHGEIMARSHSVSGCLVLLSTLTGCATVDPYSGSESESSAIEAVQVGQTVDASFDTSDASTTFAIFDVYSFRGSPGDKVTVTARSGGTARTYVGLSQEPRISAFKNYFAKDEKYHSEANGPHSEVVATLPPDDDGIYYIYVSALPRGSTGPYTLSVVSGAAPAADLAPTPASTPAAATAPTAPRTPQAVVASAPEPIFGNTGKYMCPFTEDGTVTVWVEKGMSASVGANVGSAIGAYAGQKALEQVPFLGGFLGGMVGKATGREVAIRGAGGWEFIKQNSDLSFDSLNDMARYLQATNSSHPQYAKVLQATYGIYPELQQAMLAVARR